MNALGQIWKNLESTVKMDGDEKEEVIAKEEAVEIVKQVINLQKLENEEYELER